MSELDTQPNALGAAAPAAPSALMAELNGLDASTKVSDVRTFPPASTVDPLETKPTGPAPSPVAVSRAVSPKGYKVMVQGEYYASAGDGGKGKVKKSYEAAFNLPSLDSALGIIKGRLLNKALAKKYADFTSVRTHIIVSATPLTPDTPQPTNLQFMSVDRLIRFVEDTPVPLDPKTYPADGIELRAAIIDFVQNPVGFAEREKARVLSMKKDAELAALNPDLNEVP